ncbi:hypothetical protein IK110_01635 [Candidatus Saccharibacteria bacterium]|nr:hypothetical protein [Candidatus Saccharibacteria bacterium]
MNHGKPYKKETVGSVISATVIEVARLVILIFGGFFARIGWPQVVWIGFMALSWGCYIAMLVTKEEMKGKRRFTSALVTAAIMMTLYIFGGFFA